jgi:hypothetical protein
VIEEGTDVRGGVNARLHLLLTQHFDAVAHGVTSFGLFGHSLELPRGDSDLEFTGPFKVALDVVARDGRFDLVEVLSTEALNQLDLVGKASNAVQIAVGERRGTETAVAT